MMKTINISFGPLSGCIYGQGWWFRLWGKGLSLVGPASKPLFSERLGYRRPLLRCNGFRLFYLKSWLLCVALLVAGG